MVFVSSLSLQPRHATSRRERACSENVQLFCRFGRGSDYRYAICDGWNTFKFGRRMKHESLKVRQLVFLLGIAALLASWGAETEFAC